MSIKKYYFPPVGFGFWFQFGVLNSIKDDNFYTFLIKLDIITNIILTYIHLLTILLNKYL